MLGSVVARYLRSRKDSVTLPLTFEWFDKIASGEKTVEYRRLCNRWQRLILERQPSTVVFMHGYSNKRITASITKIDVGSCTYDGWSGDYIRIHFTDIAISE